MNGDITAVNGVIMAGGVRHLRHSVRRRRAFLLYLGGAMQNFSI